MCAGIRYECMCWCFLFVANLVDPPENHQQQDHTETSIEDQIRHRRQQEPPEDYRSAQIHHEAQQPPKTCGPRDCWAVLLQTAVTKLLERRMEKCVDGRKKRKFQKVELQRRAKAISNIRIDGWFEQKLVSKILTSSWTGVYLIFHQEITMKSPKNHPPPDSSHWAVQNIHPSQRSFHKAWTRLPSDRKGWKGRKGDSRPWTRKGNVRVLLKGFVENVEIVNPPVEKLNLRMVSMSILWVWKYDNLDFPFLFRELSGVTMETLHQESCTHNSLCCRYHYPQKN